MPTLPASTDSISQNSHLTLPARIAKFREMLSRTFAGALFDIDGTLTVRGDEFIPPFLVKELARLSLSVPMGVCTARKFEHAYAKIAPIFAAATDSHRSQENFLMVCENGCIGYAFNTNLRKYEEFFRVPWPYDAGHFAHVLNHLRELLGDRLSTAFACEVSMIFRPQKTDDPDREALAKRSRELATLIASELETFDPKRALGIGDSGTGVTIFPLQGNKQHGTLEFGKWLATKKGFQIDGNARDIAVVGDQPVPPGNDAAFLDGTLGTPFTVGAIRTDAPWPLPVFDEQDKIVSGPEGTFTLLQLLSFRTYDHFCQLTPVQSA